MSSLLQPDDFAGPLTVPGSPNLGGANPSAQISPVDEFAGPLVPPAQLAAANPTNAPSFLERFGAGLRDPIDAGAQMISHAVPASVNQTLDAWAKPLIDRGLLAPANPQSIDTGIQQRNADLETRRGPDAGIDWARLGGNLVTQAPIMAAGGAPNTLLKAALTGARMGGTAAALTPETTPNNDFWAAKRGQVEQGAATGAVLGPVAKVAGGVISPQVNTAVKYLTDRGVVPTMGQIAGGMPSVIEDKLTSLPYVGDMIKGAQRRAVQQFNTAAYNEALKPIGQTVEAAPGREAVTEVEKKLGDAYDSILPNLTFKADPQFSQTLGNLHDLAQNMPPPQRAQFTSILQNKVLPRLGPGGTMDGQTFKGLDSELGKTATGYLGDSSFDNRQLGSAVRETQSILRQQLERSNPQEAARLSNINQGWAVYTRIRDAASRIGSDNGVFTPEQLQSAVRAGDKSVGKGAFAKGDALLQDLSQAGKSVLGGKYPDSGTAGRGALPFIMEKAVSGEIPMEGIAAAGGAALPYTATGQRLMKALMVDRPDLLRPLTGPLSSVVRRAAPFAAPQIPLSSLLGATRQPPQ